MKIEIDDATGLPKLPEGQWWEVIEIPPEREREGDRSLYFSRYRPLDRRHFQVRIMRTAKVAPSVTYRDRGWWRSNEAIWTPETTVPKVVAFKRIGEYRNPEIENGVHFDGYWDYVMDLTPQVVRKYARVLVEHLEKERLTQLENERQAAEKAAAKAVADAVTKSLLGAYPPKSLKKVDAA